MNWESGFLTPLQSSSSHYTYFIADEHFHESLKKRNKTVVAISQTRNLAMERLRLEESLSNAALLAIGTSLCFLFGRWDFSSVLVVAVFFGLWLHLNTRATSLEDAWRRGVVEAPLRAPGGGGPSSVKSRIGKDTSVPLDISMMNTAIKHCWPQMSLHLERKVFTSVTEALGQTSESSGRVLIKSASLLYSRFERGYPHISDIRAYGAGWIDERENLVVEMRVGFDGVFKIGIELVTWVGTWPVCLNVTALTFIARMTFTGPMQIPPFMNQSIVEVLGEPELKFTTQFGGFDPSKLPSIEHYLKDKLITKLKKSVWHFTFGGSDSSTSLEKSVIDSIMSDNGEEEVSKKAVVPVGNMAIGGILHLFVEKLEIDGGENSDPNRTFSCAISIFNNSHSTEDTSSGKWNQTMSFALFQRTLVDIGDADVTSGRKKSKWTLNIRVTETVMQAKKPKKMVRKTKVDVLEILGPDLRGNLVRHFHCLIAPKETGLLVMRAFWEPLLSPYDFQHEVILPCIDDWGSRAAEGGKLSTLGVLQLQVSRVEGLELAKPTDLSVSVTFTDIPVHTRESNYEDSDSPVIWDEDFNFLSMGSNDGKMNVVLKDGNKEIGVFDINVWDVLTNKMKNFSCYVHFPVLECGAGANLVLGFALFPTSYFYAFAKRRCFSAVSHARSRPASPVVSGAHSETPRDTEVVQSPVVGNANESKSEDRKSMKSHQSNTAHDSRIPPEAVDVVKNISARLTTFLNTRRASIGSETSN